MKPPMERQDRAPFRKRLAPPWVIAVLGLSMLAALSVLFPRASLFQQLGRGDVDQADSLRVILLRNLILQGEKGVTLRKDYIRQLGLVGDYAGAFAELDRLAGDAGPASMDSVRMLEAEVATWALASRAGKSQGEAARGRFRRSLEALLREGAPSHLAWAAARAESGGEYDMARRLYLRLARGKDSSAAWYRRAAVMSAAMGRCEETSAALFAAQTHSRTRPERKAAFLDALRALQSCNRLDEALRSAKANLGDLKSDSEILLFLVNLARSANQPLQAQKYAQMLVKPLASGPEL